MNAPRSPLAAWLPGTEASPRELDWLRREAWRQQGVIVIRPTDALPVELRRGVEDWARREMGRA